MGIANAEQELFEHARAALAREAGLDACVLLKNININEKQHIDYLIRFAGQQKELAVEVKRWANNTNVGALINQIRQLPREAILVADYINPIMALKLKEEGIQFFDAAGNAYIDQPPVFVQIRGNKLKQPVARKNVKNRAFDATGLKVTFGFLCNEELLTRPYRDIARQTGVALGTIGWVLNGLKDAGYLIERGKEKPRKLKNKKKLLDRWVEAYPEKLQPKLFLGVYRHEDHQWWKAFDINKFEALWGGEVAAAKYTQYLKPLVATVFLRENQSATLIKELRLGKANELQPGEEGLVNLYQQFWGDLVDQNEDHKNLAPPIVVYAELLATGESRNIETAELIYERFIDQYIREN